MKKSIHGYIQELKDDWCCDCIRKWTIDTGSSLMQSNSLQKVKREIFNSRVTLNDLGSFKSLPKIMSDLF